MYRNIVYNKGGTVIYFINDAGTIGYPSGIK